MVSVSEAPKEAPARKFVPASVYLEEKTDEQKKEEVRLSANVSPSSSGEKPATWNIFFYRGW